MRRQTREEACEHDESTSRRALGERVLVAWNARREAARAAFDALPLLPAAQEELKKLHGKVDLTVLLAAISQTDAFEPPLALFTAPGDVVIVQNPSYPIHIYSTVIAGAPTSARSTPSISLR